LNLIDDYSTEDILQLFLQLIRTGTVSSVNKEKATVKVFFEDRDESVSGDLQVVSRNTMNKKDYWLPEVDEMVLCLFDPRGEETGYVIGVLYSDKDKTPAELNKSHIDHRGLWIDGKNYIYFDEKNKEFVIGHENPVRWVET